MIVGQAPQGVADIASDVGYESEPAFNRAFKREFGLLPARNRREQGISSNKLDQGSANDS